MQPSNGEMESLRKTIEVLSDQIVRNKALEEKALEEFSAMNNELVTLQRQLAKSNAELKEARTLAQRANEDKSQLLAMISHEIRTPMSGIIGMTELMDGDDITAVHQDSLHVIQDSATLLLNMINDLLDLSKIDAGKMELKSEQVHINSIIHHIYKLLDLKIKDNGNILLRHLDEGILDNLMGDAGRINQIMLNLLNNANKFTSYGYIHSRVLLVEDFPDYQHLRFEVEDSGIGISSEDQDRLFQPYTQTEEGSSPHYGGTGLGLSICKSFVELMQGCIGVESEPGKGSCFWFEVKLEKGVYEKTQISEKRADIDSSQSNEQINSLVFHLEAPILVAEDNPINRQVIVMQLRRLGIQQVDIVSNGEEAILAASNNKYALIFIDNNMPKINGLEAVRRIRDHERELASDQVPIIGLTGNVDERIRDQCLSAGMNDYLTKPSTLNSLAARLREWLPLEKKKNILDKGTIRGIQELSEGEENELLSTLYHMYTVDTPGKIEYLQHCVIDGEDAQIISAVAHDLKSSSLSLGIEHLSVLLTQIEIAAREGQIDICEEKVKQLLPAYEEACRELEQYLK